MCVCVCVRVCENNMSKEGTITAKAVSLAGPYRQIMKQIGW